MSNNLCDTQLPLTRLIVSHHFDTLSEKEKKYAHYISKASWFGSKILASTLSPESLPLVDMILDVFTSKTEAHKMISFQDLKSKSGVNEIAFDYFLEYSVQVLYNQGNFMSFGDSKFIPRLSSDDFERIIRSSGSVNAIKLFLQVKNVMYSTSPSESLLLGFPANGHVSGYYSENISQQDIESVQILLEKHGISSLNTRLFKDENGYKVMIASMDSGHVATIQENGICIQVEKGDFKEQMTQIVSNMESALPFAANSTQESMIKAYVSSFQTGSMEDHKESQKHWIKDIGPCVETNIGFIETYKDPAGVRAEWEGFVAIVNKEMTKKFESLVNKAPSLIPLLPWSNEFEKDSFMKPDFTSLEVLTFATSGSPPAGMYFIYKM